MSAALAILPPSLKTSSSPALSLSLPTNVSSPWSPEDVEEVEEVDGLLGELGAVALTRDVDGPCAYHSDRLPPDSETVVRCNFITVPAGSTTLGLATKIGSSKGFGGITASCASRSSRKRSSRSAAHRAATAGLLRHASWKQRVVRCRVL